MTERLIGRTHALAVLGEAVAAARAGRGQLLLVTGEAGIGKTAIASQVLGTVVGRGMLVAWAACASPAGAQAYWPWVQVLRAITAAYPDLAPPAPFTAPPGLPGRADPDEARFALFDALGGYLVRASGRAPLAIVLDDLHSSDEPSMHALRFVAGQVRTAPILLLGTYREAEAGPVLRDLARGARLLPLAGLDEPAVAELMAAIAASPPDPRHAHEVWLRTGGNPFFVRELTRLLDTADDVPDGIRDILGERLSQLSAPCRALLATAAVAGREFSVDLLVRVTGRPADEVVDLLEAAVHHRVLLRPPAPPGRYRFVHDLFRQTVADALPARDRAARHLVLARMLAELSDAGRPVPAARLAAHFFEAGPDGAAEAVRYAALAAAEATSRLADEDACGLLERALAAADLTPEIPDSRRLALLLDLADTRSRAGRAHPARDAYHQAAGLAKSTVDDAALVRAALGLHHLGARSGSGDQQTSALLHEVTTISTVDTATRALVLAAYARDLHHQNTPDPRPSALAAEAIALARTHEDPGVLAACLLAAHDAAWRPGSAAERLPIVTEIRDRADDAGDTGLLAQACQLRAAALLELGEPAGVAELARSCRLVERSHHPRARWNALTRRATLATLADRLDEAQRLADHALSLGIQIGEPDAYAVAGALGWVLGVLGRPVELPDIEVYGRTDEPIIRALAALSRNDRDRAARLLTGYPVADLPRSHDPEPLVLAAVAFADLGPDPAREQLYDLLLPLAGSGAAVGGAASFQGPVDLYLGKLAVALRRHGTATAHYHDALRFAQRLGAPAWVRVAREHLGSGSLFQREGELWRLRYAGQETLLPDGKGLHDLATLLAAPGREVTAADLLGLPGPAAGGDPVLDPAARTAYQRRLAELAADIDEAEADHDPSRAENARTEREFLLREIATATGLGGRTRRLGDETEKARKTITARIRHTIARIARTHPELGAHLDASICTGNRCSYQPSEPTRWQT